MKADSSLQMVWKLYMSVFKKKCSILYLYKWLCISSFSLLFSCPVMSNSLQPHGLQDTSLHVPHHSPSPKVCPSSCSLHWWCHPTISSSDTLFSFWPQSFQHQGLFSESVVHIRWTKYWSFSFQYWKVKVI